MITIDSQIWIYYWDSNALEHQNIKNWMKGTDKDGILFKEELVLSSIIPIEMGHNLYRTADLRKDLDKEVIEELLLSLISTENCHIIEIDELLLVDVIQKMKDYSPLGVGGRDTLILATMDKEHSLFYLIESIKFAYSKNCFTMGETEVISKALRVILKEPETK